MNKNDLEVLVNTGLSIRQISSKMNMSYTTVRYWMKKFDLHSSHIPPKRWNDTILIEALKSNTSYAGVLREIGLDPRGSNYKTLKHHINKLNLDTSHISYHKSIAGRPNGRGRPIEVYLTRDNAFPITSSKLKRRLLREQILENKCYICNLLPMWNGNILVMRLDHIDGISNNNEITNLRLVCPNCDSQLPTYCGKNNKKI